jgi:hypothetical protein
MRELRDRALRARLGRYFQANFCFTLAEGLPASEVLTRFGAVPTPTEEELFADEPRIGVTRAGRWAFALEPESSRGADPEVLCAVSRGTRAVSVRRALDSHLQLAFAEDGVLVTSLVTIPPITPRGADPDRLLPVLRELGLAGLPRTAPVSSDVWAVIEAVHRAFDVSLSAELWEGPFTIGEFPQ